MASKQAASGGITLGSLIAVLCSWTVNHSVLWCLIHFFCSWFYVIYYFLTYAH
jgi:hypothetical protein